MTERSPVKTGPKNAVAETNTAQAATDNTKIDAELCENDHRTTVAPQGLAVEPVEDYNNELLDMSWLRAHIHDSPSSEEGALPVSTSEPNATKIAYHSAMQNDQSVAMNALVSRTCSAGTNTRTASPAANLDDDDDDDIGQLQLASSIGMRSFSSGSATLVDCTSPRGSGSSPSVADVETSVEYRGQA